MQRAKAVSNNRINYITAVNNSAPAWQKANNMINWGDTINANQYNEFTEYISAFLRGMKIRYNIEINSISLFNEPGVATFYESLTSGRQQVKDITVLMKNRLIGLDSLNLLQKVDIVSPDCIAVSATGNIPPNVFFDIGNIGAKNTTYYLDSAQGGIFANPAAVNSVDIIGTHNYYEDYGIANWSQLKSVSKNKPIWITEACHPSSPDINIDNAIIQMKWIHRSFTEGNATAFLYHVFYEPWVNGKTSGLVAWNGNTVIIPKRYYAFKQFVNFIKPGYSRVSVQETDPNLYVSAFSSTNKDTLIIEVINDKATPLIM